MPDDSAGSVKARNVVLLVFGWKSSTAEHCGWPHSGCQADLHGEMVKTMQA
jgi:hypothetical protein